MRFHIGIGPNIRKSAYFDATVADGVRSFSVYNHMYMPGHFGDPEAEYDRLINGVAMWDVAGERQVELAGPDAGALAQYLTGRNLDKTRIGQGRYVPLCDYAGRLINDPVLLKLSEERYWLSVADSDIHLWAAAIAHERGYDVQVSEPDVSPLAIQGPKAEDVTAALFGDWVRDLKYFWFKETSLQGIPLVLARSGWSKQGGFELYLMDQTRGGDLWQLVKEAGAPFDIGPGAPNDTERLESGLISYGADVRLQTHPANPFELGLGPLIDLAGPHEFVGRKALEEIAARGPTRRWVGLFIDGPALTPVGHPVDLYQGGAPVGYVSEYAYSKRLRRNIGTAMIPHDIADGTGDLEVRLPEGACRAEVTTLPFVK